MAHTHLFDCFGYDLNIRTIEGNCPVQADGTIRFSFRRRPHTEEEISAMPESMRPIWVPQGKSLPDFYPFYFRARHDGWHIEFGTPTPERKPFDFDTWPDTVFCHSGVCANAGWISQAEALRLVAEGVDKFVEHLQEANPDASAFPFKESSSC